MWAKILEVVTVELVTLVSLTNGANVKTRSRPFSGEFCHDNSHGTIKTVYINFTGLKIKTEYRKSLLFALGKIEILRLAEHMKVDRIVRTIFKHKLYAVVNGFHQKKVKY